MELRRLTNSEVTPEITQQAKLILAGHHSDAFGTEIPFVADGTRYMARIERHYHPPGGPLHPWGPHPGVSTFAIVEGSPGLAVPPPGAGTFKLGARSLSRLEGLHEDLVRVVKRAIEITPIDFSVIEGVRSKERQAQLVAQGASKTMQSRHLTGHAVDLAPYVHGALNWEWPNFRQLAPAVQTAAKELQVALEWGGNWDQFPDGPHWQLPWSKYPTD